MMRVKLSFYLCFVLAFQSAAVQAQSTADVHWLKSKSQHFQITLHSDQMTDDGVFPVSIINVKLHTTQIINVESSISGKPTQLNIDDYNFDGYKDLAFSHVDDGMGVYDVYDVFIFQPKSQQFKHLSIPNNSHANCDSGFSNVKLNKSKRMLTSSCRGGARWWTDRWTFDRSGRIHLLKHSSLKFPIDD